MAFLGLKLDPNPALSLIPVMLLLIAFLVYMVNGVTQFFVLTGQEQSIVGFVGFALIGLATFLTSVRNQA